MVEPKVEPTLVPATKVKLSQLVGALPAAMHKCVPRRFRSGALECDGSAVAEGGCCLNEWHGDGDEESIWHLLV